MALQKDKRANQLTSREAEILKLISEGLSNREVADYLELSIRTVEAHRARIMIKLSIFDVPGLVKYAIRSGLTDLHQHGAI